MSWRDLIEVEASERVLPWIGGREVQSKDRSWKIEGRLPPEHGWWNFSTSGGRFAKFQGPGTPDLESFFSGVPTVRGYLVGNKVLRDSVSSHLTDPEKVLQAAQEVFLVEPGLDQFTRVKTAQLGRRLFFWGQEFPLGPEGSARSAFQERVPTISNIPEVTPALDLAFRFESLVRDRVEARRVELEEARVRAEEEARARAELLEISTRLGDGLGRRQMAVRDFQSAAQAALAVGGAELLSWRPSFNPQERVVQFRYRGRRFECVCDMTLHIIDSGICLTGNDFLFTLESLPPTIGEAIDEGVLHVFRHV